MSEYWIKARSRSSFFSIVHSPSKMLMVPEESTIVDVGDSLRGCWLNWNRTRL